ncbi:DUF6415 family natural product biosynthesis protein [Streptomyces lunaelactis]|uniref:DUF6415 family natural product biosynthesis protein n=1 Tax=Streptomyces lunaelactis TaxID=1535768 RepID=UPI001584E6C3|nr:DUF6415 family natural product biosynthesis protein [Streptomyces lunaelactis]NUK14046.1 hypothetical protein [Streptomyces lunaelactis]
MSTAPPLRAGHADSSLSTTARVMYRLHDAFLNDEDLDDDLDVILGAAAGPTGLSGTTRQKPPLRGVLNRLVSIVRGRADELPSDEVPDALRRAERLSRMLDRLVNIACWRTSGCPDAEMTAVINRAYSLRGRQRAEGFVADRAHLRLLALTTLDLLEMLTAEDDEPPAAFGEPHHQSGWSA